MSVTAAAGLRRLRRARRDPRASGRTSRSCARSPPATGAAMFTQNRVQAAPVVVSKRAPRSSPSRRRSSINSGVANAATGEQGDADALATAAERRGPARPRAEEVLVLSTGVIGAPLPLRRLLPALDAAAAALSADGGADAAEAIMTTDTHAKDGRRARRRLHGRRHGEGLRDDPSRTSRRCSRSSRPTTRSSRARRSSSCGRRSTTSFNAISVDGECSTNDAVVLLANGAQRRSSGRRRPTRRSRSRCATVCADLVAADRRRRRGHDGARRDQRHRRASDGRGEGDRAAHRDLAARQDRALRPRRELGPRARWPPARRRSTAATRRSIPTRVSLSYNGTAVLVDGAPQHVEPPVDGGVCTIELDLGLGDGSAALPDERPLLRLRADQRGVPLVSRLVVKVGGAVAARVGRAGSSSSREEGHEVFVVHGAGPQITHRDGAARASRSSSSAAGGARRAAALEVVRESLAAVNAALCAALGAARRAGPRRPARPAGRARCRRSAGRRPAPLPAEPLLAALARGEVPVVAPLAVGPLNVNADDAAAALALGVGAKQPRLPHRRRGPLCRRRGRRLDRRRATRAAARRGRVRRRHPPEAARRGARRRAAASRATIGRDGGGRMTQAPTEPQLLADLRAPRRHVRRRRRLLARRRRRQALPRPRRRHRRRRPRPPPPRAARGRARAARPALARLEPLLDRADGAARARALRPLRRRAARSSATPAPRRSRRRSSGRARRPGAHELVALEGSFHGRTIGALSVTGQPAKRAAFEPLVPGVRFATPETLAEHVGAGHGRDPARAGAGRGRRASARARDARARRARSPTSTARCSIFDEVQTGVGRTRRVLRLAAARRPARRGHAREGPRERAADRRAARRRRRADRLRARRPRLDVRRQPGRVRGRVRRRRRDRRRRCSRTCARSPRSFAQARRSATCAALGLLLAVELDRPAAPVVDAALEHGLVVGTAGENDAAPHAAADDLAPTRPTSRIATPAGGARRDDEVRAAGRDPAPRPAAAALDAGRGRRRAARERASTPCRRRSRATSRSSGSSRCATATAGSSTRCPAPPTSTASTSSRRRCAAGWARSTRVRARCS